MDTHLAELTNLRLRRQWLVHEGLPGLPSCWPSIQLHRGYVLQYHPETVLQVVKKDHCKWCVLGASASTATQADFGTLLKSTNYDVLSTLDHLVGVYALVEALPTGVRIFTDPAGLLNVFYDGTAAASTPTLLPSAKEEEVVPEAMAAIQEDHWLPGSATAFAGVRVLLANHFLDLPAFSTRRFWPRSVHVQSSSSDAIEAAVALLEASATSLMNQYKILVSLTGGLDSRVNLACLKDNIPTCHGFTIAKVSHRERHIVDNLLQISQLKHDWIAVTPPDQSILDIYDDMTLGQSLGARRDIADACWHLKDLNRVHLGGDLGGVAWAFYWPSGRPTRPSIHHLLRDFRSRTPLHVIGFTEWYNSLPEWMPDHFALNLLYYEQRGCRWMGAGATASNLFYTPMTLFSSRQFLELFSSMPLEMQTSGRFSREIVRRLWPELAQVPYASGTSSLARMLPGWAKSAARRIVKRK